MKLKILESFKDKYTDKIYKVAEVIDVKKERADELLKTPYVEEVKETKAPKDKTEK